MKVDMTSDFVDLDVNDTTDDVMDNVKMRLEKLQEMMASAH